MYTDLAISETGDLLFTESFPEEFNIKFSTKNIFTVSFYVKDAKIIGGSDLDQQIEDYGFGEKGFGDYRFGNSSVTDDYLDPSIPRHRDYFYLSFRISTSERIKYRTLPLNEVERKIQAIKIALRTEKGELARRDEVGSDIYKIMHKKLLDNKTLELLKLAIKEAIVDIVPEAEIIVVPERSQDFFYCQSVGVYIYQNEILLFKYEI